MAIASQVFSGSMLKRCCLIRENKLGLLVTSECVRDTRVQVSIWEVLVG